MNTLTINLFGKELRLRFGGLAWEYFFLNSKDHKGLVKSMSLLIYAAVLNEDEITGKQQGYDFKEVYSLVDSAYAFEKESAELSKAEQKFQEMNAYKAFIKRTTEAAKKKDVSRKKS